MRFSDAVPRVQVRCDVHGGQSANKAHALRELRARLQAREEDAASEALRRVRASVASADFGRHVRTYTLDPVPALKETRLPKEAHERHDVFDVLEGDGLEALAEDVFVAEAVRLGAPPDGLGAVIDYVKEQRK